MRDRRREVTWLAGMLALTLTLAAGCGEGSFEAGGDEFEESTQVESSLSSSQRRQRARIIQEAAAGANLTNGVLLVGIANSETYLAHCWSEATWACQGPYSSSCGGPIIAGSGDGPCYLKEGGLGYFQFDAGTYDQTLAREGRDVLTIEGNTRQAVEFVVNMTIRSRYISGVSTRQQAIDWLNKVRVDGYGWDAWIKTVVHYYNGCIPGRCSVYNQRYNKYSRDTRDVYREMGQDFWYGDDAPGMEPKLDPVEVYWARQADGSYDLRALAPQRVERVEYKVDAWTIGEASRADGSNFPDNYTFSSPSRERLFQVLGYDGQGELVARGVGLLDVTDEWGVYIKQMGEGLYEIGLERAPEGVASVSVTVDDRWMLTDQVSGDQRSERAAVRSSFSQLGERRFKITTYNADGSERGNLYRTFELE